MENTKPKKITLTQQAYLCGGNFRLNGGRSAVELTVWYQAHGVGEDGTEYLVVWDLLKDYDPENDFEENACDWDNPIEVIDEDGQVLEDDEYTLER